MDILQQAPEIRLRRNAHGSIMVYEPQPNLSITFSRYVRHYLAVIADFEYFSKVEIGNLGHESFGSGSFCIRSHLRHRHGWGGARASQKE
jgi:hypothetical protein